jgi:hypothetical protein
LGAETVGTLGSALARLFALDRLLGIKSALSRRPGAIQLAVGRFGPVLS